MKVDVAIGLTEAFVAGIGKGFDWCKLIGTYVHTPLCKLKVRDSSGFPLTLLGWAISTGINRDDLTSENDIEGKKIGISRIGRYVSHKQHTVAIY